MKKFLIILFTVLTSIAYSQTITRGPYMTVPTSTSITIQWKTSTASNSEVKYGTTVGSLSSTVNAAASVTSHSVTLTGLVPNTRYYYSVGKIGTVLQGTATNNFYTAPNSNTNTQMKFWVTGDFGDGSSGQLAVRNSFTSYIGADPIKGWIWLGDNAYDNGTDSEYQTKVFDVYTTLFKSLPVFPALGNHDYAQAGYLSTASRGINFPYFSIFTLPTNGDREKYYSTNYGNVHFIALDSYGSYNTVGSAMYNWLQADLAANSRLWTIVYFHHPPYTKGSHDSDNQSSSGMWDMRNNLMPLIESYGVDVVLSGHSHTYERSFFMKGHFGTSGTFNTSIWPVGHKVQVGSGFPTPYTKSTRTGNGTVYAVCGVGGKVGGTSTGWPHNAMHYTTATTNGSLLLTVTGDTLNCKFLTSTGTVPDQFSIVKNIVSLPIELSSFQAYRIAGGAVNIDWSTASETNNDYFTVERTTDFDSIEAIATIPGAGNSTTTTNYSTVDRNPITGTAYYRIKNTDYDGNSEYSAWAVVYSDIVAPEFSITKIYPNPASTNFTIEVESALNSDAELKIYDLAGRIILNVTVNLTSQTTSIVVSGADSLPIGSYLIELTSKNITISSRILIQ